MDWSPKTSRKKLMNITLFMRVRMARNWEQNCLQHFHTQISKPYASKIADAFEVHYHTRNIAGGVRMTIALVLPTRAD